MSCNSFLLVILVPFLKASQQWSLVASCDVFDVRVVGIHLYTIRPYLAMWYALKQISYWYIYDFLLDILFLPFVNISCVHPSLWIDIILIFIYLESYTLERSYISSWYPLLSVHRCFPFLFLWWLREGFCLECRSYLIASCCILMLSCVVKIIFLMLVLTRLLPS